MKKCRSEEDSMSICETVFELLIMLVYVGLFCGVIVVGAVAYTLYIMSHR